MTGPVDCGLASCTHGTADYLTGHFAGDERLCRRCAHRFDLCLSCAARGESVTVGECACPAELLPEAVYLAMPADTRRAWGREHNARTLVAMALDDKLAPKFRRVRRRIAAVPKATVASEIGAGR